MNELHIGGLRASSPEKVAKRYRLGAVRTEINLNEIAGKDFSVCSNLEMRDQRSEDSCTSHAVATAIEAHEGTPISQKYQFMQTKLAEGRTDTWGASLEDALGVPVKIGALKKEDEPEQFKDAQRDEYVEWSKWPPLEEKASPQVQQSYWWIEQGGYPSIFDALIANLYQNLEKKNIIISGAPWRNSWTFSQGSMSVRGQIPKELPDNDPKMGHAFDFCGVKHIAGEAHLVAHLSNGEGFGDKGHFYFPKNVVEKEFKYGFAMYLDIPAGTAKKISTSKYSPYWNSKLIFMWNTLYKINSILSQLLKIQGD